MTTIAGGILLAVGIAFGGLVLLSFGIQVVRNFKNY
jgi:hypothetical protein